MPGIVKIKNRKELVQLIEAIEDQGGDASQLRCELEAMTCYNKNMSNPSPQRRVWPIAEVGIPEKFEVIPLFNDFGDLFGFRVVDPSEKLLMSRKALVDWLCEEYPKIENLRALLDDASIVYHHYEAEIKLPEKISAQQLREFGLLEE